MRKVAGLGDNKTGVRQGSGQIREMTMAEVSSGHMVPFMEEARPADFLGATWASELSPVRRGGYNNLSTKRQLMEP